MSGFETFQVAVEGGSLTVGAWGPEDGPLVVAAHGITSTHRVWGLVGRRLAEAGLRLLAPDLRGRGGSAAVPGSSLRTHADDLWAIADATRRDAPVILVGHSMGGFVAAVAAGRRPERTRQVVLVDGGPPLHEPLPPDIDADGVDDALAGIIGPALDRLAMTFESRNAYRRFWAEHPSFTTIAAADRDAVADYDLVPGEQGRWRSGVRRAAVIADARDLLVDDEIHGAYTCIQGSAVFIVAERGMLDQPEPLYSAGMVERARAASPGMEVVVVPDTNHYSIVLAPHGADAIAARVLAAAGRAVSPPPDEPPVGDAP